MTNDTGRIASGPFCVVPVAAGGLCRSTAHAKRPQKAGFAAYPGPVFRPRIGCSDCVWDDFQSGHVSMGFLRDIAGTLGVAAAVALAGCSGSTPSLTNVAAVPDLAAVTPKLAPADAPRPVGAPTEIYTRIARGILTCWFGPGGPMKPTYIYHADAEPPSKGGASVISIHLRDREATDPRSIRAWKLAVVPAPEGTTVDIENFKLPPEIAEPLTRDARRWAAGEEECSDGPSAAAAAKSQELPAAPAAVAVKKPAAKPARPAATAPR